MTLLQTRAQADLKRAVDLMTELRGCEAKDVQDAFTRRAKDFPALVMQVGLAQALAFSAEKAKQKKENALGKGHAELLRQVGALLGQRDVVQYVQQVSAAEYMHLTRRVLSAWTYHRRFAVALLGDPQGAEDAE